MLHRQADLLQLAYCASLKDCVEVRGSYLRRVNDSDRGLLITRRHIVGALLTHIVALSALQAQVPATPAATQRAEIQQAVRAYIDAHNRSDAATIADMYSRQPGVTSVGG